MNFIVSVFMKDFSSSQPTLISLRPLLQVHTRQREGKSLIFFEIFEYSDLAAIKVNSGLLLLSPLHKHHI